MEIVDVRSQTQLDQVRQLFHEYWRAFGFDPCFQNFDREVEGLPGSYAAPHGRMGLALVDGEPAGCIALRPVNDNTCEMKRLYVRDAYRGKGVGIGLVQWLIEQARHAGYKRLCADTMPTMQRALAMYEAIGFRRAAPYTANATPGAIYLALEL